MSGPVQALRRVVPAAALAVLASAAAVRSAEPVRVGEIREGLSAPMSLAADGDRIVVLEPYRRQIAAYSADGFEQHRLDIDAEVRALARLGPTVYLFCDPSARAVRSVDVVTGVVRDFAATSAVPMDVTVDGGRCYVLESDGGILVTDANGAPLQRIVPDVPDGTALTSPTSLARDAARGRFHVLDQVTSRVLTFDPTGAFLGVFCSFGGGDGEVTRGGEIACDESGRVLVCDRYQGRVAVFDSFGAFVCNIDPQATGDGALSVPTGIAVDGQGLVYVSSLEGRAIGIFRLDPGASGAPLAARPFHPPDRATIPCADVRLMASLAPPAVGTAPTGADFRVFAGADPVDPLIEVADVPVAPAAGGVTLDPLVAEWVPALECSPGELYAWQARGRSPDGLGEWSPLQWFTAEATAVAFHLGASFPNPCTVRTVIPVLAPGGADANLQIFDLHGRVVWSSTLRGLPRGRTEIVWDGRGNDGAGVAAGVYFYRLHAAGYTATRKLVLMR